MVPIIPNRPGLTNQGDRIGSDTESRGDSARPLDTQAFDDAQAQAEGLRGWNQQYQQLSRGPFHGVIRELFVGKQHLFLETLNKRLAQSGMVPEGSFGVGVPIQLDGPSILGGRTSEASNVHIFSGRDGFQYVSPETHVMAGIEVRMADFLALADSEESMRSIERLASSAQPYIVSHNRIEEMRVFIHGVFNALAAAPELLKNNAVTEALDRALLSNLMELFETDKKLVLEPTSAVRRWSVVSRARDLISSRLADPFTVAELAAEMQVPRRTLQHHFQETLGIRPVEYLRVIRLNEARRRLSGGATISVTDVATSLGFWHFGHFSRDYRQLFGELPSQTLKRVTL